MIEAYPEARIEQVTDTLAGVSFEDPYRWLEQDSAEVRLWQRAQAELARVHVREWPHYERLRELVGRFYTDRSIPLPRYASGKWFRMRMEEGASQSQVVVSDEPGGDGRVLFDPVRENPSHPPYLSWIAPSPDGRTLALGICDDGSENNTIRLIDVATGRPLSDSPMQRLMDNWTGGVQWLPDSQGFFFSGINGAAVNFKQEVYLHRRLPAPTTVRTDIAWTKVTEYRAVVVSRTGQHAVALERINSPIPVAIARLADDHLRWQPFVTKVAGTLAGHIVGERYVAVTDVGAPRGRLVAIGLDALDPNDPKNWQELVAESDAVLRSVTPVGNVLYLTEFVDTYARIRIVDLDGKKLGEVPLPGRGATGSSLTNPLSDLLSNGHPDKFVFAFSSLTSSPGIYSHKLGDESLQVLQSPRVCLEDAVVEDCWATASDGTRIPYHVVRRAGVNISRPQPTLIYAYGGFKNPMLPRFPGAMAAFIAAGGVYVHAHLRGGGEFGREWWHGGRLGNKQNSYNDLYAVAEDLIATSRSEPQLLAVTGTSNGGLMAGVALTQRPDLWKVVVPQFPLLDCIGACRDAYGRLAVTLELANINDPDDVRRLATFSPYHLVRDGVQYPAVYLDAGDTDPRASPWHARKFAARLQRATRSSEPILLHVRENVGHGWATDKNVAVTQYTDWLAFTLRHLGVRDWEERSTAS